MKKETNEEILARLKATVMEAKKEVEIFWSEIYPEMNKEDRVKYWGSSLFRDMRTQGEIGQDPYNLYTEKWLKSVLDVEPDFIDLLPGIFRIWSGVWRSDRIERKVLKLKRKIDNATTL